ncbi:NfeD family protein [Psychromicrobium xiongbiense]|uniref:NfeD family protein n=1 Tax=Psychromicrobium xiongbiense TaxID=3051184 RepID=UPI002556ECB7|nr:NfeD family protein [Psychromicrobium sp. YIM S02556]
MLEWFIANGWALWLAVFLVLAVIEMLTLDLFFIMLAGGALVALLSALLGAPIWLQVIVFCVVALVMILFLRPIALRHLHRGPVNSLSNVPRLLGQSALTLTDVTPDGGRIKIGGDVWSARSPGGLIPSGHQVTVHAIEGATAVVVPLAAPGNGTGQHSAAAGH